MLELLEIEAETATDALVGDAWLLAPTANPLGTRFREVLREATFKPAVGRDFTALLACLEAEVTCFFADGLDAERNLRDDCLDGKTRGLLLDVPRPRSPVLAHACAATMELLLVLDNVCRRRARWTAASCAVAKPAERYCE